MSFSEGMSKVLVSKLFVSPFVLVLDTLNDPDVVAILKGSIKR